MLADFESSFYPLSTPTVRLPPPGQLHSFRGVGVKFGKFYKLTPSLPDDVDFGSRNVGGTFQKATPIVRFKSQSSQGFSDSLFAIAVHRVLVRRFYGRSPKSSKKLLSKEYRKSKARPQNLLSAKTLVDSFWTHSLDERSRSGSGMGAVRGGLFTAGTHGGVGFDGSRSWPSFLPSR